MGKRSSFPMRAAKLLALTAVLMSGAALSLAQMTITPPNTSRGFTISTYADGFPNSDPSTGVGPLGVAFLPTGAVAVTNGYDHGLYLLGSHADNQTVTPANIVKDFSPDQPLGAAQLEIGGVWHYYLALNGNVVEYDPTSGNVIQTVA